METKSTVFSAAVPVPELLDKHNYEKWAILVRTYLEGQDLWEDIINDNENATAAPSQNENDDGDAIKVRRRRNFMALHVIQTSCGPDAFSKISTIRSADTAWQTLKRKYLPADTGSIDKSYLQYADLYRAVRRGNLTALREFLDSQPRAVSKAITNKGETALHIAIAAGHAHIVEELVRRMSEEDLGIADGEGYTAPMLVLVYGISELKHHFPLSSLKDMVLAENGCKGAMLLTRAIYTRNFDLAFELISSYPNLTLALDDRGESPFLALASMPQAFPSGNRLSSWRQRIYSRIQLTDQSTARFTNDTRLDINNERQTGSASAEVALFREVVSTFQSHSNNMFGILSLLHRYKQLYEQLYEMKKIHIQSEKLLALMFSEISRSLRETGGQLENIGVVYDAINRAVKNGIPEFVSEIVPKDPRFLEHKDRDSRNILLLAVLYRQYEIFRLISGLDKQNILASSTDRNDDNMLHMAGIIEDSTKFKYQISGAALQIQRDLQWFEEVEKINPKIKKFTNKDGLTPRELFRKNHENMIEKGEKWMRDTASSCTVVGALIITIMFAVAFTVPGGNDQTTGSPIFLKKDLFILFITSDALSLFLASVSVLLFLAILLSRYREEEFLVYLPEHMILGLLTLFCSIVSMMITFSSALLIVLHGKLGILVPLIYLACIPASFAIGIGSPILEDMIKSTYFPGIFNRILHPWWLFPFSILRDIIKIYARYFNRILHS